METLFALGQLVATPGAIHAAHEAGDNLLLYICRHSAGDWGDLDAADMKANAEALKEDLRILSAYHLITGEKIYVITEWDRSYTTVMLAEDY